MGDQKETPTMTEVTPEALSAIAKGEDINKVAESVAKKDEGGKEPPVELNKTEPPVETPKVDAPPADGNEPPASEPQEFNIEFFNKQFSTDYKDEGGIKEALEAVKKIESLQKQVDTISTLQEELDFLREEADPKKYFTSDDDFKVQLFKRDFPDKDPAMVARLFSTDLSQANDFDILTWMTMLDNPNLDGGEAGARELVADLYGVDDPSDLTGLDTLTKNKLRINASKEKGRLNDMKSGIELPEKKDYSSVIEQRKAEQAEKLDKAKQGWKTVSDAVTKEFPDLVIKDVDKDGNETEAFRYSVGKDLTEEMIAPLVESFAQTGVPINEQSAQALGQAIQKEFIFNNVDKIIRQAVKDAVATKEEEVLDDQHNPGRPNDGERPVPKGADHNAKILQDFRGGGSTRAKRAF